MSASTLFVFVMVFLSPDGTWREVVSRPMPVFECGREIIRFRKTVTPDDIEIEGEDMGPEADAYCRPAGGVGV